MSTISSHQGACASLIVAHSDNQSLEASHSPPSSSPTSIYYLRNTGAPPEDLPGEAIPYRACFERIAE